jgi:hypothetical protein
MHFTDMLETVTCVCIGSHNSIPHIPFTIKYGRAGLCVMSWSHEIVLILVI